LCFFNLLSTFFIEFLCIYLALLLDFQAIKTLSILKLKLFNVVCYVGWLMCFILNLNSRLDWFHSRIYKNVCQIPILIDYCIPTNIWVHSWLGFQKKGKKILGFFFWSYFLQITLTWNKLKWKKSNNLTQDNSCGGGDFHLHT